MSWFAWSNRKAKLQKEAVLHGEWWIIDGQAQFADGDIGDLNHEGAAIESARNSILSDFGVYDDYYDWDEERSKLCQEFIEKEKLDPASNEEYILVLESDYDDDPVGFFWSRLCEPQGVARHDFEIAEEIGDVRALAMQHWGHKRMVRTIVETYSLTPQDLTSIVDGIWDAYGEEIRAAQGVGREITFTIEVDVTRSLYEDIPISVLEKNNVSSLASYRERY